MSGTLRFLADEDFDNDIVRGMLRRLPNLDIVRAQDVGLSGALDPRVLEWAAQEGRVLLRAYPKSAEDGIVGSPP